MASVTIRNLDEAVLVRLRRRAVASGRSLEEELRRIMRRAADVDRDDFLAWVDVHRIAVPSGVDVVDVVRRGRQR